MSYYVANENGMIDQFASGRGYSDLIQACYGNAILMPFFEQGVTEDCAAIADELEKVKAAPDVVSTATGLARLIRTEDVAIIYSGEETSEAPEPPD